MPAKGGQNFQNMPSFWRHLQKSPPKTKNVFSILITRHAESVDMLDSSLAQSPGELKDYKVLQKMWSTRDPKG